MLRHEDKKSQDGSMPRRQVSRSAYSRDPKLNPPKSFRNQSKSAADLCFSQGGSRSIRRISVVEKCFRKRCGCPTNCSSATRSRRIAASAVAKRSLRHARTSATGKLPCRREGQAREFQCRLPQPTATNRKGGSRRSRAPFFRLSGN